MLILTRKVGETVAIGDDIQISIVEVKGNQVKLGIQAPRDVEVHREEVYLKIQDENRLAANVSTDLLSSVAGLVKPKKKS